MDQDNSVLGLTTIRRNRGVTLEQIAQATKIGIRTLRAIEAGDFKKLPGGIYNTSYIRQYARAIDFDESTLLDYYHREAGGSLAPEKRDGTLPGKNKGGFGGFRPSTIPGL